MHVEVFGNSYAARPSAPARPAFVRPASARPVSAPPSLWRRAVERIQTIGITYELDEHLARDIGAKSYTVPVFSPAQQGEWR